MKIAEQIGDLQQPYRDGCDLNRDFRFDRSDEGTHQASDFSQLRNILGNG
jgi:hypothetical protein